MDIRSAFITGASSGIGEALAARLGREGVTVALAARRTDALEALAARIHQGGGKAHVYPLDVSDAEATVAAVQAADDALGGLDLVVANAGINRPRWSGKLRYEECAPILDVNVRGAVATLTAVLPRMVERNRGHLCGVSSLAGLRGLPRNACYSASKAFLRTFLESVRGDLQGVDVAVTEVRPGFVRTPLLQGTKFPTPFLVELDDAVETIVAGLRQKKAVVAFPWQLATLAQSSRALPPSLWDRAMARARGAR